MTTQIPNNETTRLAPLSTSTVGEDYFLSQITLATSLQQAGNDEEAAKVYQEILALDPQGRFGAIARKSLMAMNIAPLEPEPVATVPKLQFQPIAPTLTVQRSGPLQWFKDLPIRNKQLLGLFTSELVSLGGLVGIGAVLIVTGLRSQLVNQAKSEVAVMGITYNIKVDQMGFGFRGQSDNPAIINAAQTGAASAQVYAILRNEVKARNIEFATLVDRNARIVANANVNRRGQEFNPNNLVSEAFKSGLQIKTSELIPWAELQKEGPPLPSGYTQGDALVRYVVTPVRDPQTQQIVGALIAGDIVNYKLPIVETPVTAFEGGYSAVYIRKPSGEFALMTALEKEGDSLQRNVPLPNNALLTAAVNEANQKPVTARVSVQGITYTMAARAILSYSSGQPTTILVRGTPEAGLNSLLRESLLVQLGVSSLVLAVNVLLAMLLGRAIVRPIRRLQQSAQQLATGDRTARAEISSRDEVGQLAVAFNQMADNITISTEATEELAALRDSEAKQQRQENERLQQRVTELLLEIDGARQGDLTVQANVTSDEMGSIADAFNATVNSLRELVLQVQTVTSEVNQSAAESDASVSKLSIAALEQSEAIAKALLSVEQMAHSIEIVASSASEAARIARHASDAASKGGEAMEYTVESIDDLRNSVAETSKKVKRLTESSQEISKIVGLISEISAKTNLLAFNASIEAVRAGEHGQGFRVVADEVRRLAEQVTESTKDIEQLVTGIQQETAEVLSMMEKGTAQVVTGSQMVSDTREILSNLVKVSQQIDQLVQSISASTASQTRASQQVSQTIKEVAQVAQDTSSESQAVSSTLKRLVEAAENLQSSVAKFRVDP